MKLEYVEKGYDIGLRLKELLIEKLSKLDRYFDDANARIVCSEDKKNGAKMFKMEITITTKGMMYRTEVYGESMYDNIDQALPKLERQIIKAKEMRIGAVKKAPVDMSYAFLAEKPKFEAKQVIKVKTFELEPMGVAEAQMWLEALDHTFYVFMNEETGTTSVLYRRNDNQYGLINTI